MGRQFVHQPVVERLRAGLRSGGVAAGTPGGGGLPGIPAAVVVAGELDRCEALGDGLQAGRADVLFGLRLGGGGRVLERGLAGGVEEAQRVVALGEMGADGHRGRHRPLERVAGDELVAVRAGGAAVGGPAGGERAAGEGSQPLIQDDGRFRSGDGLLLADHQLPVPCRRRPMHPAHRITVTVFPGHDVVVARVGTDARCGDAVVSPGPGQPRDGKFDGGGRHGEDVAVVDGVAVQRQPEGVAELGRDRPDDELAAFPGAQMVFVPARPARCRTRREPEHRGLPEPGGQALLHEGMAGSQAGPGDGQPDRCRRRRLDAGGTELPVDLKIRLEHPGSGQREQRQDKQQDGERQQVPAPHYLGGEEEDRTRAQQAPAAARENVPREPVNQRHGRATPSGGPAMWQPGRLQPCRRRHVRRMMPAPSPFPG